MKQLNSIMSLTQFNIMIYFTSDLHFGHKNVLVFNNRPFKDVDDMNQSLIRNYNEVVSNSDDVYILGDLSYHCDETLLKNCLSQLKGHKTLVLGNHDKLSVISKMNIFEDIVNYQEVYYQSIFLVLSHYPFMTWNKSRYGAIHLHGHIHSDKSYNKNNIIEGIRRFDVGVDANDYKPVSITDVLNLCHEIETKMEDELNPEVINNKALTVIGTMIRLTGNYDYKITPFHNGRAIMYLYNVSVEEFLKYTYDYFYGNSINYSLGISKAKQESAKKDIVSKVRESDFNLGVEWLNHSIWS